MAPLQHNRAFGVRAISDPRSFAESGDFSLVLGGPIYQLFRKAHLSGDHMDLLGRRVAAFLLMAWLPLLLLSPLSARIGGHGTLSFLRDVEVQVRFLVALPVLIIAELVVHLRVRPVVHAFVERRLVLPEDVPRFHNAIDSAVKLRNSIGLELGCFVLVYTVGLWFWSSRTTAETATWYSLPGNPWRLTSAGFWYVFVSIPIVQFLLLRWYLRMFIWFRFLWHVRRIDLNLIPTHPDRCAGLAFLGRSSYAFGPVLFAQGAMLAGLIATQVLYRGEKLIAFKMQAAGLIAFFVLLILGPLLMFTPQMMRSKLKGLGDYGLLAQQYVERFAQKWIAQESNPSTELLGSADIQSLSDLDNSYSVVRDMRPVPFGVQDITRLAAATAMPLVPLLLTVFPPEELILRIVKIVFPF
jgi:hypothetical protein